MVFDLYGPAFKEADMNAYLFGKYVVYNEQSESQAYYDTKLTPVGA